ncbi:hypothetical protein N7447_001962 [Penicillium robsamsonii]|uniref:uncharacterized protein n=1 Tax=Penicillium robsamsonii TaxID=1792511 RepID=UPI0025497416|nr:uncharacterized protein N7447_001962 [Penicillium robsamsonii]KAJ5835936.1 hypothetical protein N7447_001962 [Penicillium robsamsonii]
MYLPAEIIDLITFYVEIGTSQSSLKTSTSRAFRIVNNYNRRNLAKLRLVNKSFCHSASARLFRHILALAGSLYHTRHFPSLGKLVGLSNSPYAQHVRQVDIGYGSFPCSIEEVISYTEDLAGLLSSCLRQFPNLKALDFRGPSFTFLPYDKTKASIDSMLMSLCYVPLPNLTELELQLPMTNDFAPLFAENISTLRIPIEQTLSRLHYLGLHVYAQTNQQSCAAHLLNIVKLSTSLTSLSLSSTNYLSIDRLKLGSTVRLRFLSLHKVKISSRNLVNIIEQCSESMQYIELRHVKLEAGTWREILSAIDSLPHLYDFDISVGETPM